MQIFVTKYVFVTILNACLKCITDEARSDQLQKKNGEKNESANLPTV